MVGQDGPTTDEDEGWQGYQSGAAGPGRESRPTVRRMRGGLQSGGVVVWSRVPVNEEECGDGGDEEMDWVEK
jgi:hypothetical protein